MSQMTEAFKPMLQQSGLVNDLCRSLTEQAGITHFGYIEIHEDGSFIELESNVKNFTLLINSDVPATCPVDILNTRPEFGIYLSDTFGSNFFPASIKKNHAQLNKEHFMQILERSNEEGKEVVRYYTYGTHKGNSKVNRIYVNHLDFFHQFNKYFRWRMHEFISRAEKVKVNDEVSTNYGILLAEHNKAANMKSMLKVMPELMYTRANATVTVRQREVLTYYMQGLTAQEIAAELNLSYRTIERHLDNIRSKFKCNSRRQLLSKLLSEGFTFEAA